MLVFAIAGDASLLTLSTPITDGQRAAFRVAYALAMALLLLSAYGAGVAPHWRGWAAVGLWLVGAYGWGVALGVVSMVHHAMVYLRGRRLLKG